MSNETLYFAALNRLSSVTSGSTDFDKISRILIKSMYPDYDFKSPEGGHGTQDGGYDGHDYSKKAKLACSLEKNYKAKIKDEVEKSRRHGDLQIFYFSNQSIPEDVKNQIKEAPENQGIELLIFGIDQLSREIEVYFQKENNDTCLYELLDLSFLKNGERYRRGDAHKLSIDYDGSLYLKKISIIEDNDDMAKIPKEIVCENPLFIYIHQKLCENDWTTFPNIFLSGIGYIGKTFLSRLTFNRLIDTFSVEENRLKYNCLPFLQSFELKYYAENSIISETLNPIDPLLVFLDGLDEITPSNRIVLAKEIRRIIKTNPKIRFIISGRDSSYAELSDSLCSVQTLRIEKYVDPNDVDLAQILNEYNATPIADLLPIPVYRNFIKSQRKHCFKSFADFIKTLIENNLEKDRLRNNYALNNPKRATPTCTTLDIIIDKLSVFCLNLFYNRSNIFTEDALRESVQEDSIFFFILQSSIIDYKDREHISFVSNFYYEYFVANGATKLNLFKAIKLFIRRNKIIISHLDIFVIFLKLLFSISPLKYQLVQRIALCCSVDFSLVCDFEIFSDNTRYYYFRKILKKYNLIKRFIYYGRFRPEYGLLKNIGNMAQKMQELLPESVRENALAFLITQIRRYLKAPDDDNVMTCANCTTLLTPYIGSLWDVKQQYAIQEISIPLLKFFLYNKYAKNIKNMLSYHTILLWYKEFAWTEGWKQEDWDNFINKITGLEKTLDCEIESGNEFALKITLFEYFHETKSLNPLLRPLLFYAVKENRPVSVGKMQEIPAVITDKDTLPLMQIDYDLWGFYTLLENIDIPFELILELLVYISKNNLKDINHSIHDPVKTLESQFYDKIRQLAEKHYQDFSDYFLRKKTLIDMDRFFKKTKELNFDNLKIYLIDKVCSPNIKIYHCIRERIRERLLSELLDLHDVNQAEQQLKNLKNFFSKNENQGIYAGMVYETFHNQQHILNKNKIIQNDYNTLFAARIAAEKIPNEKREAVKCMIADMLNREGLLINDNFLLAEEVKKAIIYLNDDANFEESHSFIDKIRTLSKEHILNNLEYFCGQDYKPLPVFSETALFIIEKYISSGYSENTVNYLAVISYLQEWQKQPFYIYFYWLFLDQYRGADSNEWIATVFNIYPKIKQQILNSLDKDALSKFTSLSIQDFYGMNRACWVAPFIYFLRLLLNGSIPEWLTKENVLKLIACSNPMASDEVMSYNISLDWFEDLFLSKVTKHEIAEFGIQIISLLRDPMAHIQILKYLIDYYHSDLDANIKRRILDYIVIRTQDMFQLKSQNDDLGEFSILSSFWSKCQDNYINDIFPVFSVNIILSSIRQADTDINYQYRKSVLKYCLAKSSVQQKQRIISEIKASVSESVLTGKQPHVVTQFLAALGDESILL